MKSTGIHDIDDYIIDAKKQLKHLKTISVNMNIIIPDNFEKTINEQQLEDSNSDICKLFQNQNIQQLKSVLQQFREISEQLFMHKNLRKTDDFMFQYIVYKIQNGVLILKLGFIDDIQQCQILGLAPNHSFRVLRRKETYSEDGYEFLIAFPSKKDTESQFKELTSDVLNMIVIKKKNKTEYRISNTINLYKLYKIYFFNLIQFDLQSYVKVKYGYMVNNELKILQEKTRQIQETNKLEIEKEKTRQIQETNKLEIEKEKTRQLQETTKQQYTNLLLKILELKDPILQQQILNNKLSITN